LFVLHQQKARSNVLVVFNLTSFKDFRVVFPDKADRSAVEHNSLYHVNILGQQTVNAILQFNPTEVRYIQIVLMTENLLSDQFFFNYNFIILVSNKLTTMNKKQERTQTKNQLILVMKTKVK